jgi:hypothetical protein
MVTTQETMFLMGNMSAYIYLGCTALSKVHTENKHWMCDVYGVIQTTEIVSSSNHEC